MDSATKGAVLGTAIFPVIGTAIGYLFGAEVDKKDQEAATAAAALADQQKATQAIWASTISEVHNQIHGDGTDANPGLLGTYSNLMKSAMAAGDQNAKDVATNLANYEKTYAPLYSSLIQSASTAADQLSQLAGQDLGTSKAYLDQLKTGTQQLNARLSSQGLLGSSAGNSQFSQFQSTLAANAEVQREGLLTGIRNTGLQAASNQQQEGQFGTQLMSNVAGQNVLNNMNVGQVGLQAGMQGAQLSANVGLGVGSQGLGQQQIQAGQLLNAQNQASAAINAPFQLLGTVAGVGLKAATAGGGEPA